MYTEKGRVNTLSSGRFLAKHLFGITPLICLRVYALFLPSGTHHTSTLTVNNTQVFLWRRQQRPTSTAEKLRPATVHASATQRRLVEATGTHSIIGMQILNVRAAVVGNVSCVVSPIFLAIVLRCHRCRCVFFVYLLRRQSFVALPVRWYPF